MNILKNKANDSPIGFFDSGVGGLTVLEKVEKILPAENFIYYGDTLHVPYGDKTKEQLLEYSNNILKFFEQKGCKAVVMACNTTSSVVYNEIKNSYDFVLYPVVQSVAKILSGMNINKLGVFATKVTVESNAYAKEIAIYNKNMKVFSQFCPQWVHIVEENRLNDKDSELIVKSDLDKMLKNNPDKIVLGCTHYPFLLNILSKYADKNMFIDPATFLANYIKNDLSENNLLNIQSESGFRKFYVSSQPELFKKSANIFYNIDSLPDVLTF